VVTLSGERARGGSVGGPGPVVHDGVLYVNSGYGLYFHLPGNVLLAFSVDGK
jgi:polyvinyl alcohol dehydrogenase (cytochrome)